MKICPKCGNEYPDTTTLCPADGTGLEKSGDSLLGKTLADKYRIDERLNEGGMGTVYRGTHVLMDKTVAIKVLRASLAADEKIVARFSREARAASRISHPHALSVTDFGEAEDGVVFLVMEFLNGQTLKQVIREDGPMPLARVVEIIRQVGAALDAAHEQGVVHRDLKSENIMLLAANGPDYAKVLDFGIAKIKEHDGDYDPGLTAPDLVIGTPQYMSPEQCSQAPDIDARSDIYSLGVIIYEMLVGHVPFTGPSPTSIMMKQLQEPVPSVLVERNDLPAAVGRVISRAMAKHPGDRYQSVTELVEDLTIAGGSEAATIPPVPTRAAPNRIEVPTKESAAFENDAEEDEVTVVRRRMETIPGTGAFAVPAVPPAAGVNPWKILIPSLAGLLVVFAVVFVFTRGSQEPTNANQTEPTLVADPNSQAVEPSPPPTGAAEQGIPAGGVTNNQVVDANANANANANVEASPTPDENVNAEVNANTANENVNANANANTNRPATNPPLPSPSRQLNTNENPTAPPPAEKKSPSPNPTQVTTSAAPPFQRR